MCVGDGRENGSLDTRDAQAAGHRIVRAVSLYAAAGDLNIRYGHGEDGSSYWAARYRSVFDRMAALGLPFVGPQFPNGRQSEPWPTELPNHSRNVPTFHSNRQTPAIAVLKSWTIDALTEPTKCATKPHDPAPRCLQLRTTQPGSLGRTRPHLDLSLPRLPAPHRQYLRRASAFPERTRSHSGPCKQLDANGRQRQSARIPLLPGLRRDRLLLPRNPARADRRPDRRIRGSELSHAEVFCVRVAASCLGVRARRGRARLEAVSSRRRRRLVGHGHVPLRSKPARISRHERLTRYAAGRTCGRRSVSCF